MVRRSQCSAPLYRLAARFCAGVPATEVAGTQVHIAASPDSVWNRILFYEDVPKRAPLLLGALLPRPIRTQGDKNGVGSRVQCVYEGGRSLAKRITAVEPPSTLQFEVTEQSLGIEDCLVATGGSYQIEACGFSSHVTLTTTYRAFLHPRWLWRRVEAALMSQLHTHILRGLLVATSAENPILSSASLATPRERPEGPACKAQSCSHH